MQERRTIAGYIECVAEQVRWKRARQVVTAELAQHLEDQRAAFASEGREDAEAERLAVEEMGDPVAVGAELDRIHRPRPQWSLISLVILIALTGTALRVWLSLNWGSDYLNIDPAKAVTGFLAGCGALIGGYFLDCSRLGRHAGKVYAGTLAAGVLAALFSPGVQGVWRYGRYAALFLYPVGYAFWVYFCRRRGWTGLIFALAGLIPPAMLCILAPSLVGLGVLLVTGAVLLGCAAWGDWFGVGRGWTALAAALCAAALVGAAVVALGTGRMDAALHPERDPSGMGYAATVIRGALAESRMIGGAESDLDYERTVPGHDADAILTTVVYKLGWLPFFAVVIAFAAVAILIVYRCMRQRDGLGRAVVLAVLVTLCVQAAVSTLWCLGYTVAGAEFPYFGGAAGTVLGMGITGLALSAFRGESLDSAPGAPMLRAPKYRVRIVVERNE